MNNISIVIGSIITLIFAISAFFQYLYYKNNWKDIPKEERNKKYEGSKFGMAIKFWVKDGWLILFIMTVLGIISTVALARG